MNRPHLARLLSAVGILVILSCGMPSFGQPVSPYRPGSTYPNPAPALMPVQNWNSKTDAKGFQWDLNSSYGCINNGTNSCFSSALVLHVNNSQFSASQQMMTPDGMEYVFTRSMSNVLVTRRVRFDLATGTVRFLESFQNSGSSPVTLSIKLVTSMSSISKVLGNSGSELASGSSSTSSRPLAARVASAVASGVAASKPAKKDFGLVVLRSSSSRPAALFYLCSPRSKIAPVFTKQGSSQLSFDYTVIVPAQKTVALLHGVAQRRFNGTPVVKTMAKEFKTFQDRKWTKDLPLNVRRTILNGGGTSYGDEIPAGPLLQGAIELADYWAVQRGNKAVLVQDEDTQLAGALSGSELTVATRFGQTVVPLEDVAVLVGGAGIERTMQVYLRNGEILVGSVASKPIALTIDAGLEIEVTPAQLNVLFTPAAATDGKPSDETAVLLQTRQGDRLAISADSLPKLRAATAWGPLEIPMANVQRLYCTRSPQPIHRLILNDRSRLSVILSGDDLKLETPRFGPVAVPPGEVTELSNVAVGEAMPEKTPDDELDVAHCVLLGENVLVGTLQTPKVDVVTAAGTTSVATGLLWRMQRDESAEGAEPSFAIELVDESQIVGHFADPILPIRAAGKLWQIPAHHVISYYQPKPKPPEDPEEADPTPEDPDTPETPPADPPSPGPPPIRPPSADPFGPSQPAPPSANPFGPPSSAPIPSTPSNPNDPFG